MRQLSRAAREEGIKQVRELRRRLRENDWEEVEIEAEADALVRVWRPKPSHSTNPTPLGYKDSE